MSKRILIAGGAGFIGSNLCRRLLSQGHNVFCIDNFSTGSKANISDLIDNPRFTLIDNDVTIPLILEIDEIYNLACPASPPYYQSFPIQTIKSSILGTMNMLELALSQEAKMLQASTSEVYGDPLVHPQREDYWGNVNPIGKRSCYDESKRCAETLCFEYWRQYGLDIKIVRIFNTYGPNMHPEDGRVISNFIVQALKGEDLTVYGTGDQTRSFCYITDLVDGLVQVMATEKEFIGPINLGNPEEFTILDLAKKVVQLTGARSRLVFRPLPPDDPRRRQPDISLARSKLGWQPSVSLDDGLKATITYFRRLFGNKEALP